MPQTNIHQCQCPHCQFDTPHPDQAMHRQRNVFLSRLDEQQRRWFAALESTALAMAATNRSPASLVSMCTPSSEAARNSRASRIAPLTGCGPQVQDALGLKKRPAD